MTAKIYFEPCVEPLFYDDSYGYRPNKSMKQALTVTRERCWRRDFVLEFDIKGLFDNIRHDYLLEMVQTHAKERWVVLYIERWLKAPFQTEGGTIVERTSGTPQGGVISPVLANLFLHYVFDDYMVKEFPTIPWARYADDGIAHCVSLKQANFLLTKLQERFAMYGLELNLEKTKIAYCKDSYRKGGHENTSFDFLGYTFRPRKAKSKHGTYFTSFLPAISEKAKSTIRSEVRSWRLQLKSDKSLQDIANMCNSKIRGWLNHYSHFYKSELHGVLHYVDECLVKWARQKYKKLSTKEKAAHWLSDIARQTPQLFAHWKFWNP
jgi:group II intron reverse transcriptase/maturase